MLSGRLLATTNQRLAEKEGAMRTAEDLPVKVERSELSFPEAEIVRPKAGIAWGGLRVLMGSHFCGRF
jgi:hypothetical protein